jgi:predicted esterase
VINQWFDIWEIGDEDTEEREQVQVEGLGETGEFIRGLIEEEGRLVGSENVVLGGLSQGCAAALHSLLGLESQGKEGKQLLGGFVGMSGWLPFRGRLETILDSEGDGEDDPFAGDDVEDEDVEIQPAHFMGDVMDLSPNFSSLPSLCTPVFMGHGKADEKVDMELGENAARILRRMGLDVIWREYDVGHWYMVPDEIDDVVTFLRESVGI